MTKIVAIVVFVLAIIFGIPWLAQQLWNSCLVPAVDGIHEIGYWQALGINVLTTILFRNSPSTK